MYQTFFSDYNSANPVEIDGPEVASRVHYMLNSNGDYRTSHPRDAAIRNLRQELSSRMPSTVCPVCLSKFAVYGRPIGKGQVKSLAKMRDLGALSRPVTNVEIGANGGDHAKLRFWGLVFQQHDQQTGKSLGWRLTGNGNQFLEGFLSVPKKIYLVQNELLGFSLEEVGVSNASDFTLHSIRAGKKDMLILCEP